MHRRLILYTIFPIEDIETIHPSFNKQLNFQELKEHKYIIQPMNKLSLIKCIPNTYVIKYSYSLFDIDKRMNCREVAIVHILYAK